MGGPGLSAILVRMNISVVGKGGVEFHPLGPFCGAGDSEAAVLCVHFKVKYWFISRRAPHQGFFFESLPYLVDYQWSHASVCVVVKCGVRVQVPAVFPSHSGVRAA